MNTEQLKETLEAHAAWLRGDGGQRANLHRASLSEANLRWANLHDADLRGADLREANLSWTSLYGADLRGADLRDADLRDADLSGADIRGANLSGVNLSGAKGIDHASIGWSSHGEAGRTLLCAHVAGEFRYFCGCFAGSADELANYIDDGNPKLAPSRRMAMWIVTALVEGVTP